jgi:hypothetical protein
MTDCPAATANSDTGRPRLAFWPTARDALQTLAGTPVSDSGRPGAAARYQTLQGPLQVLTGYWPTSQSGSPVCGANATLGYPVHRSRGRCPQGIGNRHRSMSILKRGRSRFWCIQLQLKGKTYGSQETGKPDAE